MIALTALMGSGTTMSMAWPASNAVGGEEGAGPAVPPRPLGEVGTVDTVAGPGYCEDVSTIEERSTTVRSLVVGSEGETFVDTGLLDEGLVGKVDPDGRVSLVSTALPGTRVPATRDPATGSEPAAGRLASDGRGGVLVAAGSAVVRLAADGALTTAIGQPAPGGPPPPADPAAASGTGDQDGTQAQGGARSATAASLTSVASIAGDGEGGVFLADRLESDEAAVRILFANLGADPRTFYPGTPQELTVDGGAIATIAGEGPGGDGGPALAATLSGITPVMASVGDLLYVSSVVAPPIAERPDGGFSAPAEERPTVAVRVVNLGGEAVRRHGVAVAAGTAETVAGGGQAGFSGDGGPALAAAFGAVTGIDADDDGNLYLADAQHHRIRRVDEAGSISTFAGTGGTGPDDGGFNGNDRLATSAALHRPFDVKVGPEGWVYISDRFNHQVRFVDEVGLIRAARGNGVGMTWSCGADDAQGPEVPGPRRGRPSGLAVGTDGEVYVANLALPQIKVLDAPGRVTTVVGMVDGAGCPPAGCPPVDGGPARSARLRSPSDVAARPGGGLYLREGDAPRVYLANVGPEPLTAHGLTVAPGAIETVAGNGVVGAPDGGGDGVPALDTSLALDGAVAADGEGNLFLAEQQDQRVRQVGADGVITTLVGGEGRPEGSCCQQPAGLVVDRAGNLYVSDEMGHQVWFLNRGDVATEVHGLTVGPGELRVVAGTGRPGFAGEGGPALEAQLDNPAGLALDPTGNLYIANLADRDDSIRRVDPGGNIVTVAGSSTGTGFNGDGLKAGLTAFSEMTDIAADHCGNLYVAEEGGDRVRKVNLVGPCDKPVAGTVVPSRGRGSLALPLTLGALGVAGAGALLVVRRARRH